MRLVAALLALMLIPLTGAAPVVDNDAGSGQDAPNAPGPGVTIAPGVAYDAWFAGPLDFADYYAFPATNGDVLEGAAWLGNVCLTFYTPSFHLRKSSCTNSQSAVTTSTTANVTGTWYLGVAPSQNPRTGAPYRFSLGVNGNAPNPTPQGADLITAPTYLQPGEAVSTPAGSCTMNFVYNGTGSKAGRVFIGTAAHCFTALGQSASAAGIANFGSVVYMGDYNGLNTGDFSNGIPGTQVDFALIEVNAAHYGKVKGEVKGHPGLPTALKVHSTVRLGDVFKFSGYGLGFFATKPTREMRVGVYTLGAGSNWNAAAPILSGDSGGPVLHFDGKAVGVATHVSAFGAGGPWLDVAMNEATANGWPIALRPAY